LGYFAAYAPAAAYLRRAASNPGSLEKLSAAMVMINCGRERSKPT